MRSVAEVTALVADQPMTGTAVRWKYGWLIVDEAGCHALVHDRAVIGVRPLVVIDPDDREQVADLLNAWERAEFSGTLPEQPMTRMELRLRTALREFANPTPPKPDEPTGDGAVVEDRMGHRWVRIAGSAVNSPPWRHRGHTARWWDSVQAVRVLSEGVTS